MIAINVTAPSTSRGRLFLLAGVVLLGLSLRHAVTVVSPLLSTIQRDIGLDQVGATILGMLPTIAFGIWVADVLVLVEPPSAGERVTRPSPIRADESEDAKVELPMA